MDYDAFLRAVMDRTGIREWWSAEKALAATVEALGARILEADRRAVVPLVPEPFAGLIARRPHVEQSDLADLFADVTRAEGVEPTFAMEHVESVCELLTETLEPDAVAMLRTHLPDDIAALFVKRERTTPPPRPSQPEHRKGKPLSEGRAGSAHPVSEAPADRTQSNSVARSANPHADTKLSSTHGLTQAREHEDLAEGHIDSEHKLSESES